MLEDARVLVGEVPVHAPPERLEAVKPGGVVVEGDTVDDEAPSLVRRLLGGAVEGDGVRHDSLVHGEMHVGHGRWVGREFRLPPLEVHPLRLSEGPGLVAFPLQICLALRFVPC